MLHMDAWNTGMNSGTTAVHRFNPGGVLCVSVAWQVIGQRQRGGRPRALHR
jgi:hypothetical protein